MSESRIIQGVLRSGIFAGALCAGPALLPAFAAGANQSSDHRVREAVKQAVALAHPGANVGIATGAISGVVVLDIDPRHGGDDTLEALQAQYNKLPDTRRSS